MASVRRWTAASAVIAAKLDEAEAAWYEAGRELTALKNALPTNHPPGINGAYAHLTASFDTIKARNVVSARFGTYDMRAQSLENLLARNRREPRSTETRTGQLMRVFEAAQEWVDVMTVEHEEMEGHLGRKIAILRESQVELANMIEEGAIGSAVTGLESLEEAILLCKELELRHVDDTDIGELAKMVSLMRQKYQPLMSQRARYEKLIILVMRELAGLGFKMPRQRMITEFVRCWKIGVGERKGRTGTKSGSAEEKVVLMQREITEFFLVCEADGVKLGLS